MTTATKSAPGKPRMHEFLEHQARALYRVLNHGLDYTDCRCIDVNNPGSPPVSREVLKGEETFIEWCRAWHGKANCYVGRNPRNADGTVSRITTYSLDVDPEHPPRTSVTVQEAQRAVLAGRDILEAWPGGYLAESGNGALVLYRLSHPVSGDLEAFKRWLAGWQDEVRKLLAVRFPKEVRCDSIHDNERIIKIPGTLSTKGDAAHWRLARWCGSLPAAPYRAVSWTPPQPSSTTSSSRLISKNGGPLSIERIDSKLQLVTASLARMKVERCDNYDSWIKVGLALSELGPIGLQLWDTWSRKSPKYKPGTCAAKWGTFPTDASISVGSISYWADQDDPRGARSGVQSNSGQSEPVAESYDSFVQDVPEPEWLCRPIIAKQAIVFTAGLPETMKTWLLMDLAIECARGGGKWVGLFPVEAAKVLYIEQERPRTETVRRLRGMERARGLTPNDLKDRLFLQCGTTIRMNIDASFQAFRSQLQKIKPDIVIVDTFATFHTEDEKDNSAMQRVMERIKALRNEIGCAFIFVEHETKEAFNDADNKIAPNAIRIKGAVSKQAAIESAVSVRYFDHSSSKVYHTKSTMGVRAPSFTIRVQNTPEGHIAVTGEL